MKQRKACEAFPYIIYSSGEKAIEGARKGRKESENGELTRKIE